eukprot:7006932-Prymnesium_polylepis.1
MQSSPLARPVARCRAAHRPGTARRAHWINHAGSSTIPELTEPAGKRHALRLLGWAVVLIATCARTCTGRTAHA